MEQRDDPFEELIALCARDRLLHHPHATGEGVSVCIIDSGLEANILETRAGERGHSMIPIQGGIFVAGKNEPLPYQGKQSTPHGTTVADIILTIAPNVQLFSADIFGPQGSCDVEVLIQALHWAVEVWKCKVINLSLGVVEQRLNQLLRRNQLQKAIESAYFHDALVIAAAHNDHPLTRSYPALFAPPLISVAKKLFADPLDFNYLLQEQIEFQAHSKGYLGPFAQEPATSWSAPHLTGIIARLLSLRPNLKPFEIKTILYWMAMHKVQE